MPSYLEWLIGAYFLDVNTYLEQQHKRSQVIYALRHLGTTVYSRCAAPFVDADDVTFDASWFQ